MLLSTTTNNYYIDNDNLLDSKYGSNIYYRIKAADQINNLSDYSNTVNAKGHIGLPAPGSVTLNENIVGIIPANIIFNNNYPNPFNPATTIRFGLPEAQQVILTIYSITGEKVVTLVDDYLPQGYHQVIWDGRNTFGQRVASGVYMTEMRTGENRLVRKMLLTK